MATLATRLFGQFQAVLDGRAIDQFCTANVQALFVYLLAEAPAEHKWEALMSLL